MKIRVVPEARSLDADAVRGQVVVVIDTLRATTTIAHAVAAGARVEPVRTIAEARRRRKTGALIAGERGGARLAGFDFGNSPIEISAAALRGRRLVLTTTNGTLAIARAEAARAIYSGALVNAGAVAAAVRRERPDALFLVCAGRTTGVALEDLAGAGAILDVLLPGRVELSTLTDGSRIALELFRRERRRLELLLRLCESGRNLIRLGAEADLAACARTDVLRVAPKLRRGQFVA
jgi:2-phosphosulfolactate phosphatase